MKSYTVRAKRWAHGWELHIDGEGVTQSRSLSTAERQVRDYLALLHDLEDGAVFDVVIVPELGGEVGLEVVAARGAVADLAESQQRAADLSRSVVGKLAAAGLKGAEIAAVLGVSPQRVSQLSAGAKVTTKRAAAKKVPARRVAAAKKVPARRVAAAKKVPARRVTAAGSAAKAPRKVAAKTPARHATQ